jgi:hypothetical protein
MLVLYVIANYIALLVYALLLALLFWGGVMLVAPRRWFTLPRYAKVLIGLLAAVVMWVLQIAVCVLYSLIRPSGLALVGEALFFMWYFYIPFFFAAVSLGWFTAEKVVERRRGKYGSFV